MKIDAYRLTFLSKSVKLSVMIKKAMIGTRILGWQHRELTVGVSHVEAIIHLTREQ